MTLTVRSTTLQAFQGAGPDAVMVDCTGPRGGVQEFTVHLTRLGTVVCAVRTAPHYECYATADLIPPEVCKAAHSAWHGANAR